MVLPGDRLQSKLTHVGMADGKMIVNVDTFNQEGVKVRNDPKSATVHLYENLRLLVV